MLAGAAAVSTFGLADGGGTYAIVVASGDNGVQIVNITEPSTPLVVSTMAVNDADEMAAAAAGSGSFQQLEGPYDVHVATNSTQDGGEIRTHTYAIIAAQTAASASGGVHVRIVNISDLATPSLVATSSGSAIGDSMQLLCNPLVWCRDGGIDSRGMSVFTVAGSAHTYVIVASPDDNEVQTIVLLDSDAGPGSSMPVVIGSAVDLNRSAVPFEAAQFQCTACRADSYKQAAGLGECLDCPMHSFTHHLTGATSISSCQCMAGHEPTAYPGAGAGALGPLHSLVQRFTVPAQQGPGHGWQATAAGLPARSGVSYRRWNGISGATVDQMLSNSNYINNPPDAQEVLELFASPVDICDDCGTVMDAYFRAPSDGEYVFQIAGDNEARLWFGTGVESAMAAGEIASVPGFTASLEWDKYPSQRSAPQTLTAGSHYYLRAVANEEAGGDHLAVGIFGMDGMSPIPVAAADGTSMLFSVPSTHAHHVTTASCGEIGSLLRATLPAEVYDPGRTASTSFMKTFSLAAVPTHTLLQLEFDIVAIDAAFGDVGQMQSAVAVDGVPLVSGLGGALWAGRDREPASPLSQSRSPSAATSTYRYGSEAIAWGCEDILRVTPDAPSGVYSISVLPTASSAHDHMHVYCEMEGDDGDDGSAPAHPHAWTLVQKLAGPLHVQADAQDGDAASNVSAMAAFGSLANASGVGKLGRDAIVQLCSQQYKLVQGRRRQRSAGDDAATNTATATVRYCSFDSPASYCDNCDNPHKRCSASFNVSGYLDGTHQHGRIILPGEGLGFAIASDADNTEAEAQEAQWTQVWCRAYASDDTAGAAAAAKAKASQCGSTAPEMVQHIRTQIGHTATTASIAVQDLSLQAPPDSSSGASAAAAASAVHPRHG
jgi:hypothetical protein